MAKLSKHITTYVAHVDTHTGKTDRTSKNNEIVGKWASYSIKTN